MNLPMTIPLQKQLDSITMYRLVMYGLMILAFISLVFRNFDLITYASTGTLAGVLVASIATSVGLNLLFSKLYGVAANQESSVITGLILYFIVAAPTSPVGWLGIFFAALIAIASKYVITWRGAAIFNPAAFGILAVALLGIGDGAWWVASPALFFPLTILGILILAKLRRFGLFLAFAVPATCMIIFRTIGPDISLLTAAITALTLYPILFLGTIMLTEPGTMPATHYKRILFGGVVGIVFGSQLSIGFLAASPHLALLIGNVFAFAVSSRSSSKMKLVAKKQMSPTTWDFAFQPEKPIQHQAGQYMDFTLPNGTYDSRGNRRTFTIASDPGSKYIHIGVKFNESGSSFKKHLSKLPVGDYVTGNHVAGDFLLPKDINKPIVMIAGGIGITPFISMLQHIIRIKIKSNVTLYRFASDTETSVYEEILRFARSSGVKVVNRQRSDTEFSDKEIAMMRDSVVYISGSPGFVREYANKLGGARIQNIRTDYFSGY